MRSNIVDCRPDTHKIPVPEMLPLADIDIHPPVPPRVKPLSETGLVGEKTHEVNP